MTSLMIPSLLIACVASSTVAPGQSDANPLDELPPYIRKINDWGQRADFSHDGKRILFIEKTSDYLSIYLPSVSGLLH